MEQNPTISQADALDIAFQAVRLYAETHPRPVHLTQGQAAEMLGIPMESLVRMMSTKKLKLNECGLIPTSDLDRAIASRANTMPTEIQKPIDVAKNIAKERRRPRSDSPNGSLMRMVEVEEMVGVKASTIYRWIKESRFPKPLKMGFVSLWVRAEVDAWVQQRIANRDR